MKRLLALTLIAACILLGTSCSNTERSSLTATPTPTQTSMLQVLSWSWHDEYGFAIAEGEVKNISAKNLEDVIAVVTFYTSTGEFITSDDALLDYNPILPGQTSPFKVYATYNPAMDKGVLTFKYLMGGTIKASYPKATPAPTPAPTIAATPTASLTIAATSTPPPTPTLGYSRSNPAGINYSLSIQVGTSGIAGFDNEYIVRITLINYLRGDQAWSLIQAANMFNDPPKAGYEYILAKVRFEYLTGPTPDTTYDVSTVWFDAVSSSGKDYDMARVVEPDPSINADLYPGASHEGWIVFLVAQNDNSPLMTFGRKYDGTGGIWFKLY